MMTVPTAVGTVRSVLPDSERPITLTPDQSATSAPINATTYALAATDHRRSLEPDSGEEVFSISFS
jgi:hypothetical protein